MALLSRDSSQLSSLRNHERIVHALFPHSEINVLTGQGGCSVTFLVKGYVEKKMHGSTLNASTIIIQFREPRYRLDLAICAAATFTYRPYAPMTHQLSIAQFLGDPITASATVCYQMEAIKGVPYDSTASQHVDLSRSELSQQKVLVEDFANFIAQGWTSRSSGKDKLCTGRVGSQISVKLQLLTHRLPSARLRSIAQQALKNIDSLACLPVVLTHGDLIPSNMMVNLESRSLQGVVDWAEAEYLPFGICLYGLEYLLGYISGPGKRDSMMIEVNRFKYYTAAAELRRLFWRTLKSKIPVLDADEKLLGCVLVAKVVGTLLWHGFAWDEGAIDRVVNEDDDAQELMLLETFLLNDEIDDDAVL